MASECILRPAVKAVLQQLAWFADADGRNIFPSVSTIARRTGLTRRAVQKLLRELEAMGIIASVGSQGGGRGHSTRYEINMRKLQELKETANRIHPLRSNTGESEDQERATVTHAKGELRSPEYQEHEKQKKATPVISSQEGTANRIPDGLDQNRGEQVWSAVLEQLKPQIDKHSFDTWFIPPKAAGFRDGVLWIRVPYQESKEIFKRYTNQIAEALKSKEIQDVREVRFTC